MLTEHVLKAPVCEAKTDRQMTAARPCTSTNGEQHAAIHPGSDETEIKTSDLAKKGSKTAGGLGSLKEKPAKDVNAPNRPGRQSGESLGPAPPSEHTARLTLSSHCFQRCTFGRGNRPPLYVRSGCLWVRPRSVGGSRAPPRASAFRFG